MRDSEKLVTATPPPSPPLLSLRTAVIFGLASVIALIIGGVTYLAAPNTAAAVLSGLGTFGTVSLALHRVLE